MTNQMLSLCCLIILTNEPANEVESIRVDAKWRRFDQGKLFRISWPFWQSRCNVLPVATMVQDQTIHDGLHTKMSPR